MTDLSHYDLFWNFDIRTAAYLAAGADPRVCESDPRGDTLVRALEGALQIALDSSFNALLYGAASFPPRSVGLFPGELECRLCLGAPTFKSEKAVETFLDGLWERRRVGKKEVLLFHRDEIGRWFRYSDTSFKPVFQFERSWQIDKPVGVAAAAEDPMTERERTAMLNIVGAMLELLLSHRPGRESQGAIIDELLANYSEKYGISKSNLEKRFAQAKRTLVSGTSQ